MSSNKPPYNSAGNPYKEFRDPNRYRELKGEMNPEYPLPPANVEVTYGFDSQLNAFDIRWDNPAMVPGNHRWHITGVNIYRSDDNEFGPYYLINQAPIGATFFRDDTINDFVADEDVSGQFLATGEDSVAGRWIFRTAKYPIVDPDSEGIPTENPSDVVVKINGIPVRPRLVHGLTGEVELSTDKTYNTVTNTWHDPMLPRLPDPARPGLPVDTITCSYHYSLNVVPNELDRKVFYRVTAVGYREFDGDPQNAATALETPLAWCEPKTIYHMENMDYIWREAIRRNAWILDQGGERVWVFIRKWHGQRCECTDPDYKFPRSECHTCFPPGTLVRAEQGYVPIEEITIGDRVLTCDGSFQEVLATMKTPYEGDLVSLRSSVSPSQIYTTPDHPFLVERGHHIGSNRGCSPGSNCEVYISHGDGMTGPYDIRKLPSGNYHARCQMRGSRKEGRKALGSFATEEEAMAAIDQYRLRFAPGHHMAWDEAENLEKGDWLKTMWPSEIEEITHVRVPLECLGPNQGKRRKGPKVYELSSEFLWVVGIYLAEGSTGEREICFSLHEEEVEFQNRIIKYFKSQGFNPKLRTTKGSKGVGIHVGSSTLAEWWKIWLGPSCYEKRIPEELMLLHPEKQKHILHGIYDGDGCKSRLEITQTSEVLALQISEILHRMGKQPLTRQQKSNIPIEPSGNLRAMAYTVSWESDDFQHHNRKGRWDLKGEGLLSQVRDVDKVFYKGPVYNLTVATNHTYVVQGIVVHNCFGTGIVGGYEGPYEIKIAPPDTEKRIVFDQTGFTMEDQYEVWTGPSPMISQRDFIVKQNNDRYSIGPVRMPTNRGNVLQQHFSIEHIDENDLRYKIPLWGVHAGPSAVFPETRTEEWEEEGAVKNPQMTDRPQAPEGVQERGRTPTYENINRGR